MAGLSCPSAETSPVTLWPMVTEGELNYFDAIGEPGRAHATSKPFSDPDRAGLLQQIGAVMALMPEPPASVLDCGCGAGWLTWMLQRAGYDATGIDAAPTAVKLARELQIYGDADPPRFVVGEFGDMPFAGEFDVVLFFDSLHHAVDERAALRASLRALKPGGVCLTSEPGKGHAESSREQVEAYGVTERDMPARHIRRLGLEVGFSEARIFPRTDKIGVHLYGARAEEAGWKSALRSRVAVQLALVARTITTQRLDNGIVVLRAP